MNQMDNNDEALKKLEESPLAKFQETPKPVEPEEIYRGSRIK